MENNKRIIEATRLQNIVSLCTVIRIFEARLKIEKRSKIYKAIKQIIVVLETALEDIRAGE